MGECQDFKRSRPLVVFTNVLKNARAAGVETGLCRKREEEIMAWLKGALSASSWQMQLVQSQIYFEPRQVGKMKFSALPRVTAKADR